MSFYGIAARLSNCGTHAATNIHTTKATWIRGTKTPRITGTHLVSCMSHVRSTPSVRRRFHGGVGQPRRLICRLRQHCPLASWRVALGRRGHRRSSLRLISCCRLCVRRRPLLSCVRLRVAGVLTGMCLQKIAPACCLTRRTQQATRARTSVHV